MKRKATWDDLFEAIPVCPEYSTGLEILRSMEDQDFSVRGMRGVMYVHLSEWQDQGLVNSRYRSSEDRGEIRGEEADKLRLEYCRVPGSQRDQEGYGPAGTVMVPVPA